MALVPSPTMNDDPWASLRPAPDTRPHASLASVGAWAFVASLFVFPLALVALVVGALLTARERVAYGVTLMCLSAVVLTLGLTVVAASV